MNTNTVLNGAIYETNLIQSGLTKLGIDAGYEIVISDHPDIVENTAADELQKFLGKGSLSTRIVPESKSASKKRLLLGRDINLQAVARYCDSGDLSIRNVSSEDDGFHLRRIGADIVVAGANPRGVLYGVYAFEDFVMAGAGDVVDIQKVPYFRRRGSGPCYSFNAITINTEDFPDAKAAYLSRIGINELTDQGLGGHLDRYVKSDVFPFQIPPKADYQRKVKAMSTLCKKYGIDLYLFISAPNRPDTAGDIAQYPQEAIGTVRRPWGGGKDGLDKTLCISSPIVQDHFRNMMRKLVREYPDIKGVQFYNMDGDDWLCTPALCDRCKTICTDSPQDEFNPWETQALLVTLLAEAAHQENPDFDFRLWGAVHYHGERFDKMIHAAQGFNSLLCSWTASDRTIMVPDAAEIDPAYLISQQISEERSIPLHMMCEMNNHDIVPQSLPYPVHVCDALAKYKRWGVRNLTEIFGMIPEHNSINALVTKEFEWNPDQDVDAFLADLAVRQFGEAAGKTMRCVWEEMGKAFDVWNDVQRGPFPLLGSQFHVSMGIANGGIPGPILPEFVANYSGMIGMLSNVEPWFASGYQTHKQQAFLDKMQRMNGHLAQATELAKQAIDEASEKEFIDICYYEGVTGRPTCKEYAELNYAPIALADVLCRQRCNTIRAYHLLMAQDNPRTVGNVTAVRNKKEQYLELIREDIGVQERFYDLLSSLAKKRPCYLRTSLTEPEISDLIIVTRNKIMKLLLYIKTQ
ncbi:MAG: alpha-glucuronidase family glycosyl hydrolase [Anaerolineae bacterium]